MKDLVEDFDFEIFKTKKKKSSREFKMKKGETIG